MSDIMECSTYWARIYIAGDYDKAREICREYVMKGLCINISKTDYIYTMGEEQGICVEIINYPRFTRETYEIKLEAYALADTLLVGLCQGSYTIMFPDTTHYSSRRDTIRKRNKTEERLTPY